MASKSAVVSGMGVAMSIITSLDEGVRRAGGSEEDIHRLTTPGGQMLIEQFSQMVVRAGKRLSNIFKVIVDYSLSLAEMIQRGKYDWPNPDITEERFPYPSIPSGIPRKLEVTLELIHFNRRISSEDAIAELKRLGYRPATIWELLFFGMTYPDKQREFPIVALGSIWRRLRGVRYVACLWSLSGGRSLYLGCFESGWGGDCRFLAVRETA